MAVEGRREKLEGEREALDARSGTRLSTAARLSDADLLRRVVVLATAEREATVELVAHLAELDARRLHLGEGYSSLFGYCTGVLRLAEHAAYNRIEAARASREFPAILDLLADGSLNLSTVRLLAPHLRADTFAAVVDMAKGKSKREVEALVARLAPRPDVASSVRRLPAPVPPAATVAAGVASTREPTTTEQPTVDRSTPASAVHDPNTPYATVLFGRSTPRPVVAPLAPGRYRVQFTVGEATHEKLRRAQDLLRREVPDGDPGAIFDRALTLLLEDIARKKLSETSKPRPRVAASAGSRHIPARVKRAVWLRDGGRCAFVGANGRRCAERAFLEFHHGDPYAIGGEATEANIALRCHAHNAYEAELAFGSDVVSAGRAAHVGRSTPARVSTDAPRECAGSRHGDGETSNSPRGELDTSNGATIRSGPKMSLPARNLRRQAPNPLRQGGPHPSHFGCLQFLHAMHSENECTPRAVPRAWLASVDHAGRAVSTSRGVVGGEDPVTKGVR